MAYDERLAARVRALLGNRTDVSERKMFGGLTFMIGGNMCRGVNRNDLSGASITTAITKRSPGRMPARWTSPADQCAASSRCTATA